MSRSAKAFFLVLAAAAVLAIGALERSSVPVDRQVQMDTPRPIFEPINEARQMSMPCTYIQVKRFDHEPVHATNTRCVNADRSE